MKILAVGAHPDDVEIGSGGFLLKNVRSGNEVFIYVLTRGEAGESDQTGTLEEREHEARLSAKEMGAKEISFGGFKDTRLSPGGDLVDSIESVINHVHPDVVLMHPVSDEHHDHRAVGSSTVEAARSCRQIFAYENPLTKDFLPQHYVDISDLIDEKIGLLSIFSSQNHKVYLLPTAIRGLAQYRAYQSRIPEIRFAEAFQVVKCTVNCISSQDCP